MASKEFEYFNLLIDKDFKKIDKNRCNSCGENPQALHIDGNFKLPRYDDSMQK